MDYNTNETGNIAIIRERRSIVGQVDKLCLEGIYRQGYGIIPKFVMHDPELTLEAKAIYAYLCSLAGSGDTTFPYRDTILRHLGISKNTYYKHYNLLLEQGYLSVTRPPDKTAANIYTLVQNPKKLAERSTGGEGGYLRYRGLKSHGYGFLPRTIMLDETISSKAKGLYAYFSSYCGDGDSAFPLKDDIVFHLGISEPTYYKITNQLKDSGYIEIIQRKDNGRFAVNDYYLNDRLNSNTAHGNMIPPTTHNQVDSPPMIKVSNDDAERPRVQPKNKQNHSAPLIEATRYERQKIEAWPSIRLRLSDIKKWDTIFGDTKNCDNNYNISNSSNSTSNINPSMLENDGRKTMRIMVMEHMEALIGKPPRKSQETAVVAREFLIYACKDQGGSDTFDRLRDEFLLHLESGLADKRIRNLQAYCKASLYNWLAEYPLRKAVFQNTTRQKKNASYNMEKLEQQIEAGNFV